MANHETVPDGPPSAPAQGRPAGPLLRAWAGLARFIKVPPDAELRVRRRPTGIFYGIADSVPAATLAPLAIQHALLSLTFLIYVIVAAAGAGMAVADMEALLGVTAIGMGFATIIQCARTRFGSGMLIVHIASPSAIPVVQQALLMGGPGMMAASTLLLGVGQVLSARLIRPLRILLPPEVCGVAVTMLGVSLADTGLRRAFGSLGRNLVIHHGSLAIALVTLGIAVAITVFAPRSIKLFAVVAGAAVGWVLAEGFGIVIIDMRTTLSAVPWFGVPHIALPEPRFDLSLVPMVLLAVVINLLDIFSTAVTLEKMEDAEWRRANLPVAQRAVTASGLGNIFSGLIGGFPTATSSSAVGLAFATGVTARVVGVCAGVAVLAIAFFPKIIAALTLIPSPVIGGLLLYTAAFMIVTGMNLVLTRRLNDRRIFLVGLSIIAGLSVAIFPLLDYLPVYVHPLFSSPLTVSASFAVVLNLIFRFGVTQADSQPVSGDTAFPAAREFLERVGDRWGARRDIVEAAIPVTAQAIEMVANAQIARGAIDLHASFDEAHLDVHILYDGDPISPPKERPDPDVLLGAPTEMATFMAYILTKLCDETVFGRRGARACITLRFHH